MMRRCIIPLNESGICFGYGFYMPADIKPRFYRITRPISHILAIFHLASVKIGCERVDLGKSILI